jgi:phosphate-selective porin OprO and OprP
LISIDRSNLANNIWFAQEYIPGVSLSGRVAPWNYRAGVYSSGSMNREFGRFDGSVFTMAVLGYDFAKKLRVREAVLTGNYVYQRPDALNTFTKKFEHIGSVNFRIEQPRWGFRGDVSKTAGYLGQRDVIGVMAMPFVNATSRLQFVIRYTHLASDGNNGLSLATYENKVARGGGDRYREGYIGANYYFYGHRLKLQSGVQFADMRDRANDGGAYSGTSWVTGLRVGW